MELKPLIFYAGNMVMLQGQIMQKPAMMLVNVRYISHWIPPTRIELVPLAPEANALSAELRGLIHDTIPDFLPLLKSEVIQGCISDCWQKPENQIVENGRIKGKWASTDGFYPPMSFSYMLSCLNSWR
jgi:hypothetical protein